MKKLVVIGMTALISVACIVTVSQARTSYLNGVNSTCGTSYSCGICHVDPRGGGPLTADGAAYKAAGYDACYFCANVCGSSNCTDADKDAYFAESGCGTSVDCQDNNAAINPGATEICNDGIDNDCDGKIDCADSECSSQCSATTPEVCNDGIDNDGDRKVDCADRDCRKDPACISSGSEGKGKTCSDGKDNDGDGAIDCADPDCASNRACK